MKGTVQEVKSPEKYFVHIYIYVKFLALLGAPYICDISRLRVKCGLFLYGNSESHNLTINFSDDGVLHENMPVILNVFHHLGFFVKASLR
jgi:hypothetical protein